ncbi:MAG: YoaK family protein [Xanthobacteraceae bacterium]
MRKLGIAALLSFNGGFVDTAGFLGLQGLFTAHVTGNFVTLGAALVYGTHGVIAKVLALPEFIIVVALARLASTALATHGMPARRILLIGKVVLLLAFFALAVAFGPFPDSDAPAALLTGFAGIAAMALQNAIQRIHLGSLPPTTLMTGNTTQAVLDAIDLLRGADADQAATVRGRLGRTLRGILWFASGCAVSAALYAWIGFWCLAVPVAVGAASAIIRADDP